MTFEIAGLFLLIAVMVTLFLSEKIPVDLTAFLGLVALVFSGYIGADEAFSGFASGAVITMLSIFIVSASLLHTGVADVVGRRIHHLVGGREVPLILSLMLVAGVLSAFMNNIAATAVLMPAVGSIAHRSGLAPSRLFMPLAFGAILGGTTTQIGTPPNILTATMLQEQGLEPFSLFDFTPLGLLLLGLGMLFMVTLGRRLLPRVEAKGRAEAERNLAQVYQLQEQLFSIRLPPGSKLDGLTLGEARFGTALAAQVVAVIRRGRRQLAPAADTELRGGDILLVEGEMDDLRELLRVQGMEIEKVGPGTLPRLSKGVTGIHLALKSDSPLLGRNLRELQFRDRFGAVVVGIQRGSTLLRNELADQTLASGDEILALGLHQHLQRLRDSHDFEIRRIGLAALQQLLDQLYLMHVPQGAPLDGVTVGSSRLGELAGITVSGLIRGNETRLAVTPDQEIRAGDRLLVAGEPSRILQLVELGELQLDADMTTTEFESEDVGMVEAVLAPRSSLVSKTVRGLRFRERYGLQVLALWRSGEAIRTRLATIPLSLGDALLLQGPRDRIVRLASDPDFLVLSEMTATPRRTGKAIFALGALVLMIGLVMSGLQPIHVAAFTAASLVILSGALTMEEAYQAVEWKAIFLVAAILPMGLAMERTGAAPLLAENVSALAGPAGPFAVLGTLVVLSSLLSQGLDGAPAVVLLTPVVIETAQSLGLSPYPLMMGVSLAASAAFMTPFSHKANLLVMGAGGYRSLDYLRVGTPLTILLLVLLIVLVPVFFPFGK